MFESERTVVTQSVPLSTSPSPLSSSPLLSPPPLLSSSPPLLSSLLLLSSPPLLSSSPPLPWCPSTAGSEKVHYTLVSHSTLTAMSEHSVRVRVHGGVCVCVRGGVCVEVCVFSQLVINQCVTPPERLVDLLLVLRTTEQRAMKSFWLRPLGRLSWPH